MISPSQSAAMSLLSFGRSRQEKALRTIERDIFTPVCVDKTGKADDFELDNNKSVAVKYT